MTTELADVVEHVDDGSLYRITGLGARAQAVSAAATVIEDAVAQRITSARAALRAWYGAHATTYAERVNEVLGGMVDLHLSLLAAVRRLGNFPDAAVDGWEVSMMADRAFSSARVDVPERTDTSGAVPADLHAYVTLAAAQDEALPLAAAAVNLDGVTAVETYQRPLLAHERRRLIDSGVPPGLVDLETVGATRPVADVGRLVPLPDLGPITAPMLAASQSLNIFVSATALAFEQSNDSLLALLAEQPDMAVGVLDVLSDGRVDTADGALAVLSAEWDLFDTAGEGGDPDGIVSRKDIRAIVENPGDHPAEVVAAATFLERNRRFFALLETTNDPDGGRDRKVSRDDLDLFVELNAHLRTLNENFDSFVGASGEEGNGVSQDDLEAVAAGGGPLAATAQWFLDHDDQRERLETYELTTAVDSGRDGALSVDPGVIGAAAVVALAVDQQAYGAYDVGALHLRPGTIPPPPPQPYIDRGAAGEHGQDPWWSTLVDDELVETKWEAVAAAAEVAGQTDAARHLRHYLDGSGDDLALDADRILREAPSLQAEVDGIVAREVARVAETGAAGQPVPFATDWSGIYLSPEQDEDLFRAIGGVQVSVTGVVTVDPPADAGGAPQVQVEYRVHLYDRYNWDEGDDPATPEEEHGKSTTFPVLGEVDDSELAELHRAGLAQEFDMRGTSDVYTHDGAVPTPETLPDPPDGRSGRDDPGRERD